MKIQRKTLLLPLPVSASELLVEAKPLRPRGILKRAWPQLMLGCCALSATALAGPISIINPSFESPAQPFYNAYSYGVGDGWNVAGGAGVWWRSFSGAS